jgi:hypothetical protein
VENSDCKCSGCDMLLEEGHNAILWDAKYLCAICMILKQIENQLLLVRAFLRMRNPKGKDGV